MSLVSGLLDALSRALRTSENASLKLSEKGRWGLQGSLTDHPKALVVLRMPTKFTLGALLVPLFGRFLYEVGWLGG
jgi:hypothetical protein